MKLWTRHINVPRAVSRHVMPYQRWRDLPRSSPCVHLAIPERGSVLSIMVAPCWLPWNENRRPKKKRRKR